MSGARKRSQTRFSRAFSFSFSFKAWYGFFSVSQERSGRGSLRKAL